MNSASCSCHPERSMLTITKLDEPSCTQIATSSEGTLMSRKSIWSVTALLFALMMVSQTVAQAPAQKAQQQGAAAAKPAGNLPGEFTLVSKADIAKVQKAIDDGLANDEPVRTVNISNRYNLGVYTLNSQPPGAKPGGPVMGFYHNDIAEVYIIASGSGTWRVGGELEDPKNDDLTSRGVKEIRGPGVVGILKGYTDQKITTGDVL